MDYEGTVFPKDIVVVVTGGAGFIGSNLCEALLNRGCAVRCLDDLSTGRKENLAGMSGLGDFCLVEGDIRDPETCREACKGADYVLHQAALCSVPESIRQPLLHEEINIRGTLNMLEAAKEAGVKRFVYASSSAVYGSHQSCPLREGDEGRALSPYALTKLVGEGYAGLYTGLYGLETVGLRYFNVFGPRQDADSAYAAAIPSFIRTLLRGGRPQIHGDGRQSRDFVYVEDVVEANLKACAAPSDVSGHVFNIACGRRQTILETYRAVCVALGVSVEPEFVQPREGDIRHSYAHTGKARGMLGYQPAFDFTRGLALTVDWYREHLLAKV